MLKQGITVAASKVDDIGVTHQLEARGVVYPTGMVRAPDPRRWTCLPLESSTHVPTASAGSRATTERASASRLFQQTASAAASGALQASFVS